MHEQPQPTDDEQEDALERIPEEEPERDERASDGDEPEEPIHEA